MRRIYIRTRDLCTFFTVPTPAEMEMGLPLDGPADSSPTMQQFKHLAGSRFLGGNRKVVTMLVLSRKPDEQIVIGDGIVITVVEIRGDKVRLGIEAPRDVSVHRQEVAEALRKAAETVNLNTPRAASNETFAVEEALRQPQQHEDGPAGTGQGTDK